MRLFAVSAAREHVTGDVADERARARGDMRTQQLNMRQCRPPVRSRCSSSHHPHPPLVPRCSPRRPTPPACPQRTQSGSRHPVAFHHLSPNSTPPLCRTLMKPSRESSLSIDLRGETWISASDGTATRSVTSRRGVGTYLPRISAAQVLGLRGVALQMTPRARAREERVVWRRTWRGRERGGGDGDGGGGTGDGERRGRARLAICDQVEVQVCSGCVELTSGGNGIPKVRGIVKPAALAKVRSKTGA